ncbi:MAG: hypothetical protein KHZ62_04045 [Clostridiales bacterium]|nr:hypothetical protein [Clostridiales bacterium]
MKGTINIIFAVIAVLICVSAGILYQMDQDMKQNGPILFTVESISEKKEDVLTSTEGWKEAEITAVSEDHTSITAKLLSRNEELKDTYAIEGNEAGIYTDNSEEIGCSMQFSDFKKGDIIQFKFQEVLNTDPVLVKAKEIILLDRAILSVQEKSTS